MDRTIELNLRLPNNKYKKFTTDFVPLAKKMEYIRAEAELEKEYAKKDVPEEKYLDLQLEFIAGLFDYEEVTKEAILNGLDTADRDYIYEIIRYRVLGFNKEDEELLKKVQREAVLAGLTTTTSKSDLSETPQ